MDGQGTTVEHMSVDHGCFDVFVTEQFLDCANVVAVFQQVGGEGMTEGVRGDAFLDPRLAGGLPALRAASLIAFCNPLVPTWWRRSIPVRGSRDRSAAGNTYCHIHS